jgi:hypothetical protein
MVDAMMPLYLPPARNMRVISRVFTVPISSMPPAWSEWQQSLTNLECLDVGAKSNAQGFYVLVKIVNISLDDGRADNESRGGKFRGRAVDVRLPIFQGTIHNDG